MCIWTGSIEQINRRGKKGTAENAYEFKIYQEDKGDLIILKHVTNQIFSKRLFLLR